MQKPNITGVGFFNVLFHSTPAKLALSLIAILALLFVLLGGPPAAVLAQDEPTATETLAAADTETPLPTDTPEATATEEPTATEELAPTDMPTEEPTATETLAESETPTLEVTPTFTETITETPTETPTLEASCTGLGVDELCELAAQDGGVRVVVELAMNYVPPAQLSDSAEAAQELKIDQNQNALEAEMTAAEAANPEAEVEQIRELETLPYVSYVVDEAGLAELVASPLVESVHQSQLNFLSLDVSVPLIGGDTAWSFGFTGDGQTVAILDTGVEKTHEMFPGGKVVSEACYSWENPGFGADSLCPGDTMATTATGSGVNCDLVTDDPDCDHGTHVAGIAAGNSPTVIGVAPDADIIAIQVFTKLDSSWCSGGCIAAFDEEIIAGLERVLALQGSGSPAIDIAAVNLSLGGDGFSTTCNTAYGGAAALMKTAIDNLRAQGIAVVIASGNDGFTTKISYPACISTAISVGATNGVGPTDTIAAFSNRASFLSLYAPGVDIYSSIVTGTGFGFGCGNNDYCEFSGTSMAAPHVAGAFALLQEFGGGTMPVTTALNYLKTTGDPVTGSAIKRIDVWNALLAAIPNPPAPTLLTPATNSFLNFDDVTVHWGSTADTLSYQVQIDDQSTFASPILDLDLPWAGEDAGVNDLAQGKWYWRVRSHSVYDEFGPWSSIFNFTVDTIAPADVIYTLPADGSNINNTIPKLTWLAVTGAIRYHVEVGDFGLPPLLIDTYVNAPTLFYQVVAASALPLTPNTTWRVTAEDAAGNTSLASAIWSFTPELRTTPANAGVTYDTTPLLKWLAAAGSTAYGVSLDNDSDFSSPIFDNEPVAGNVLQLQAPDLAFGTYYWRISYAPGGGLSSLWTFTVTPAALVAPALISPANNGYIGDGGGILDWGAVAGATGYLVQVDNTATLASPENALSGPDDWVDVGPATGGTNGVWYWRVRGIDIYGAPGVWSAIRKFTYDTVYPVAANLTGPADMFTSLIGNPNFTWTKPADMVQSRLLIDDQIECDFNTPIYEGPWGSVVAFKPTSAQFSGEGMFCWAVLGKDAAGNQTLSLTRQVEIFAAVPIAPGPITLANAAFSNTATPEFNWGGVAYAANYEIQIDNASTFALPLIDSNIGPGTTFTPSVNLPQGLLYWRVRGINSGATAGPFSAVRTFTVDTTLPLDQPDLVAPLDSVVGVGNPTFTWTKPTDGTQTRLVIDEDEDDWSTPLFVSNWGTVLSLKPTAAQLTFVGPIQWRVEGRDAAGNPSPHSNVRDYFIAQAAPVAPVLASPPAGVFTTNTSPNFVWNPALRADYYFIQISDVSNFTNIIDDYTSASGELNYTTTETLVDDIYYWRVRGENSNSLPMQGPFSAVRTFTVDDTDPLTAAVLNMPIAGGFSVGNPTFTWTKPATATQTRLLVDEAGGGFAAPLFTSAWGTVTSLKPTAAQLTYFDPVIWTVESRDAAGNDQGPEDPGRALTINYPLPAAPVLTSPATAFFTNPQPLLDWNASLYGDWYRIQIDNNSNFLSLEEEEDLGSGITAFTPPALTPGLYYWRVSGFNTNTPPGQGPWSAVRTFTIDTTPPADPTLTSPAEGSINVGYPNFTWMAVPGATQYKWQSEYDSGDYSPSECESGWITTTSFKPPQTLCSLTSGSLEWRVLARDAAGNVSLGTDVSGVFPRLMSVSVPVPAVVPTLLGPANNSFTNDNTPLFTWTDVPYGEYYEIWVDTQSTFVAPHIIDFEGAPGSDNLSYELGVTVDPGPPVPPATLPDGVYYWWVWGFNGLGQHSAAWSAKFKFTVDTVSPPAPTLTGPANLSVARNTAPTFTWTAAAGATKYRVQYDQTIDSFGSIEYDSGPISGTSHHPLVAPAYGSYEWRVYSIDAAGNESLLPSAVRTFFEVTEALPAKPVLASPASNAMTTDNTPTFFWNAAVGADTYEIQIDNNSNFSSPEATGSGLGGLDFTSSLIPNGTYYWRVRAWNSTADDLVEPGAWSLVRILKIVP